MSHTLYRELEGTIRFAFIDKHKNYISVSLTQEQVDEYRDALNLFASKENDEGGSDRSGRTRAPQ
jgi:hypothetical protein